jgi:hypothetical protein
MLPFEEGQSLASRPGTVYAPTASRARFGRKLSDCADALDVLECVRVSDGALSLARLESESAWLFALEPDFGTVLAGLKVGRPLRRGKVFVYGVGLGWDFTVDTVFFGVKVDDADSRREVGAPRS